jgi:cytidylate kinase
MGWVITGVCAAGKTTVGRKLATELDLPFVEGDVVRPPGDGPSAERYQRLADALPGAVVEDVVVGPWLAWFVERASPCFLVVLAPSRDTVVRRNAMRTKDGYRSWDLDELDETLRTETAPLGLWIDSSDLSPEETVAEILGRAGEARV